MSHRKRIAAGRALGALALALILSISSVAINPTASAVEATPARGGRSSLLGFGANLAAALPPELWAALGQPQTIVPGPDGVLNVLLLASDARKGGIQRTDSIMVASFKQISGQMTMRAASIPRDTARIPNPFTPITTDTFSGRINAILKSFKTPTVTWEEALDKFEVVIEHLLGITIDEHVLITFAGFHAMVNVVDPVAINITKQIRDSKYWDDPNKIRGVYFPIQNNYDLWAYQPGEPSQLCNGLWRNQTAPIPSQFWCRRAMPFVRSRKGPGNSDFVRASRQQLFVHATIKDVNAGVPGDFALVDLLNSAVGQAGTNNLFTSFDLTLGNVTDIYNQVRTSVLGNRAVFSPKTFSTHITGTTAYQLKLDVVRNWANTNLK